MAFAGRQRGPSTRRCEPERKSNHMKKRSFILALCLMLLSAAFAEAGPRSSADRFLSNLSDTWDSFLDMAGDAGKSAVDWAESSGVADWVEGKVDDLSAWARENGLTDWARDALEEITSWADESGLSEWTAMRAQEIRAFVDENRPAVEAWLTEAGEEVRDAWDILMDAGRYTAEEVRQAYDTVTESLQAAGE